MASVILGLATIGDAIGIGLVTPDRQILGARYVSNARRELEFLPNLVSDFLASCDVRLADVDRIGVVTGPGNYTALRIGLSCAKTMAWVGSIPIVGIPTSIALSYPLRFVETIVIPILPTRPGWVSMAVMGMSAQTVHPLSADFVTTIKNMEDKLSEFESPIYAIGPELVVEKSTPMVIRVRHFVNGCDVAMLAIDGPVSPLEKIVPVYAHPPMIGTIKRNQ